ncbi:hypothetical protein [Nonlabens marinus]|uniref:Uncharacterized protein n=1 Tax=Nonlabens marinus S1-08 TaxID=1454201 RepID=W8VXF1_9FLAO|nr:hypothetical protein [Nonlabens marinus]BAO55817.1 hypothetical protein NMS_1808 [Nonlabens marinus S1-08]
MKNLLFLIALITSMASAQNPKEPARQKALDSLLKIDWLEYNYRELDEDHKILTSSDQFETWKAGMNFKPNEVLDYKDSLSVVLNNELKDGNAARIAILRLSYTWDRASWSVLLPATEVEAIAAKQHIKHPYNFVTNLRENPKESAANRRLIRQLKSRLKKLKLEESLKGLEASELMKLAFQYSPERLKVVDSILASQGSSRRKD